MVNCSFQGHQNQPITHICVFPYCTYDRLQCQQCLQENYHQVHQFSNDDNIDVNDLQEILESKRFMMTTDIVDLISIQHKFRDLIVSFQTQISKIDTLLEEIIQIIAKHRENLKIIKQVATRQQPSHLLTQQQFQQSWKFNHNFLMPKENFQDHRKRLKRYLQHLKDITQIERERFDFDKAENIKQNLIELSYEYSYIRYKDDFTAQYQKIDNFQIDPTGKSIICQFNKKIFRLFNIQGTKKAFYEFQLSPQFNTNIFKVKSFALDDRANQGILLKYINKDQKFCLEKEIKLQLDEIKYFTIYQNRYIAMLTAKRFLMILNLGDLSEIFNFQYLTSGRFQINQSLNLIGLPVLDSLQYIFFPDGQKQINIEQIYTMNEHNQLNFNNCNDKVITYTKYENFARIYKLNPNDQKLQMQILHYLNLENQSICFSWAFEDKFIIQVQQKGYEFIQLMDNENQTVKRLKSQNETLCLHNKNQIHFIRDRCQFVIEQYLNYIAIGKSRFFY